jgi:capsular exopolysaccharide synthesis family protein
MYEGVLARLGETSVTAGMAFGGFRVLEPAIPIDAVHSPRILWNILLATILGLSLGITVVVGWNYWDTSIKTIEDVEQMTAIPVLGALPLLEKKARIRRVGRGGDPSLLAEPAAPGSVLSLRPMSPFDRAPQPPEMVDGVRSVVASILLSRSSTPPRVLVVTSAISGEGKTTLACELGQALAESGARTLLVDADLRRPSLQERFNLDPAKGLSLFLSGNMEVFPVLHATDTGNLSVVAAGPCPPNPGVLVGSEKMQTYIGEMLRSFRFVILDSPPALPVADTRFLARIADGVVLVVRAGKAPKALLKRAAHALEADGGNLLGIVLTGAERNGHRASYYYRSYQPHES